MMRKEYFKFSSYDWQKITWGTSKFVEQMRFKADFIKSL